MTATPSEREINILCARVYLAEARRRHSQGFAWTLMEWAGNARRRAMAEPRQRSLFSTADKP